MITYKNDTLIDFYACFYFSIKNLMMETPTSYSLLVMYKDVIYAVRDPYGNRPLCIGCLVPISKLHSSGICRQKE